MKKQYKHKNSLSIITLLVIVAGIELFTSCEEKETTYTGPITVKAVYLQDVNSSVPDREVTFARLGQLIRIEGSGFKDLRRIYVNGFETYFNNALLTENNVWVRLSDDTPIVDADSSERNTIRLENDGNEIVYNIEIREAAPTINRISHTLPLTGETVTIYGTGLVEVSKIVLPGNYEITSGITGSEDGDSCAFVMPDGISDEGGSIFIECANGGVYSPAYFNFRKGVILDFDGNGTQGFWNNDNEGMIADSDLVSTPCGTGNVSQGTYTPHRPYRVDTIKANKVRCTEVWTAGNDVDDWRGQLTPYIPTTAPIDEVGFQFDIYVPEEWSMTGYLKVLVINSYNGGEWVGSSTYPAYIYNYVPWIVDGEVVPFKTAGWQTITIPFIEFDAFKPSRGTFTFEDLLLARENSSYKNFGFYFENDNFTLTDVTGLASEIEFTATATTIQIYTDNWRIVSLETPSYSDFPEDE